ncbi:acyltransferase [bacterium]|nr:acyltransferase [bacterium]
MSKINSFIKNNKSNTFVLIKQDGTKVYNPKIKGLKLFFGGVNNYFEIHEPFAINKELKVRFIRDNGVLIIGKHSWFNKGKIISDYNTKITIGTHFSARSLIINTNTANGKEIKIGNGCMISYDVIIRNSDAHTIFDKNTKEILNKPTDVIIGNQVWLGARAIVLKGAKIPSGCVIGAGAIINKAFEEENCILAGVPASIKRRNITWDGRAHTFWEKSTN